MASTRSTAFTTESFEPSSRFDAWRQFLPLYTVLPHPDGPDPDFRGSVDGWSLGPIGVGLTSFSRHRYVRSRHLIATDGEDGVIVQLLLTGGLGVTMADGREIVVGPGDVWVHDLAAPKTVVTEVSRTVAVLLPRRRLLEMTGAVELDGIVLRRGTPLAVVLGGHLRMVVENGPRMSAEEGAAAGLATVAVTAACLRPGARLREDPRGAATGALLNRIRAHIEDNIVSPDLTPESLCEIFNLSRSHLYRLFAPLGGVAGSIRHRRLKLAERLLRDPGNSRRTIADIAFDCGFVSEAHFSRAFRTAFGASPREIRGAGTGPRVDEDVVRLFDAVLGRR